MNFDIIQKAVPEECMRAFLEKKSRYVNRAFQETQKFNYNYGVLKTFEHSSIGSLGLNKVLLVLKEVGKNYDINKPKIIIIDNFENDKSVKNIYDFVEKLLKNNISKR